MPTKEALFDAEGNELEDLGTMSWEEAMDLESQPSGLTNRLPCPEMLEDTGYAKEIVDTRGKRRFTCIYNENYVSYYLLTKFLRPLGVISPTGEVKKKLLVNVLLPRFIEYAEQETDRKMDETLKQKAKEIAALTGKPYEFCLNFLKTGEVEEVPAKEKVAA